MFKGALSEVWVCALGVRVRTLGAELGLDEEEKGFLLC